LQLVSVVTHQSDVSDGSLPRTPGNSGSWIWLWVMRQWKASMWEPTPHRKWKG